MVLNYVTIMCCESDVSLDHGDMYKNHQLPIHDNPSTIKILLCVNPDTSFAISQLTVNPRAAIGQDSALVANSFQGKVLRQASVIAGDTAH